MPNAVGEIRPVGEGGEEEEEGEYVVGREDNMLAMHGNWVEGGEGGVAAVLLHAVE